MIACSDNPIPKPDNLLDQEEMENILYDISVLQAGQTVSSIEGDLVINIPEYIYNKYEIDSTVFFQNQRYYSGDVKKIKKMYKNVLERVQNKKNEIDTILSKEVKTIKKPNDIPQIR